MNHLIRLYLPRFLAVLLLTCMTVGCGESSTGPSIGGDGGSGCDGGDYPPIDVSGWNVAYDQYGYRPTAITGVSGGDIFGAGRYGGVFKCDGSAWTHMPNSVTTHHLIGIWAADAEHVFAVGEAGTILEYDGSVWSLANSGTTARLESVWGASATNVFAVGDGGTLVRFDGVRWTATTIATFKLHAIWGAAFDDVYAAGGFFDSAAQPVMHFNGSSWSEMPGTLWTTQTSIWGSSADDVFFAGSDGMLHHYDGNEIQALAPGASYLSKVWGTSATNVYAIGTGGTLFHYDGAQWTSTHLPVSVYYYTSSDLTDIWGSSSNDIFALQSFGATFFHFNGTGWVETEFPSMSHASVWCSDEGDLVAVGAGGSIVRNVRLGGDVVAWQHMASGTTADLKSVWGTTQETGATSTRRLVAVGSGGTILMSNGDAWRSTPSGVTNDLTAVWGRLSEFIAVGDLGTIIRYNGTQWTAMNSGVTVDIAAVWGTSMQDIFAVGKSGTILHSGGSQWHTMNSGTTEDLTGVWGLGENSVYAVGKHQAMIYYDGKAWKPSQRFAPYRPGYVSTDFTSIWGLSGNYFFAGTTGGIYVFDRREKSYGSQQDPVVVISGHSVGKGAVAVTPDGQILVYYP